MTKIDLRRLVLRRSVARTLLGAATISLAAAAGMLLPHALKAAPVQAASPVLTDGYIPLGWDTVRGKLLMQVPAFDSDVLYYVSAATGGGSVELPFDRGIMETAVIRFQRAGNRVLVVEINTGYRATGNAATAQGVTDSVPDLGPRQPADRIDRGRQGDGRRDLAVHARRRQYRGDAAPRQPGQLQARSGAQHLLRAADQGVSRE